MSGEWMENEDAFKKFIGEAYDSIKTSHPQLAGMDSRGEPVSANTVGMMAICAAIVRRHVRSDGQMAVDPLAVTAMFVLSSLGVTGKEVLEGFGKTWVEDVQAVAVVATPKNKDQN